METAGEISGEQPNTAGNRTAKQNHLSGVTENRVPLSPRVPPGKGHRNTDDPKAMQQYGEFPALVAVPVLGPADRRPTPLMDVKYVRAIPVGFGQSAGLASSGISKPSSKIVC
jgi:hypothetical protein